MSQQASVPCQNLQDMVFTVPFAAKQNIPFKYASYYSLEYNKLPNPFDPIPCIPISKGALFAEL